MFFAVVLLASAMLGGCGRRGPLELPPGAPNQGAQSVGAAADQQAATFNESERAPPGILQPPDQVVRIDKSSAQLAAQPPARAINEPRQPKAGNFLLDPLL